MTNKVLICGSIAFDTITVFEGRFKEHIRAENIQSLSVSFFVPTMRKEFGGCAGNIAYSLRLLGGHPVPVGTVGPDAADYLAYMQQLDIDTSMIRVLPDMFTPQCYITTDLDSNQITSFHPGAMLRSAENDISGQTAAWGIVAPDSKDGMFAHARRMHAQGLPFVFDLGQAMPLFTGEDLNDMLGMSTILTANDYEASVVQERTGRSMQDIAASMRAVIITQGAKGALLYMPGEQEAIEIPPAPPEQIVDPTGCGDAHRAGLLYGLTQNWTLLDACRLANVMGSFKIAEKGPQNHRPSRAAIDDVLYREYGIHLDA